MNTMIKIKNRKIGGKNKVFIIAELSANHNQDYATAVKSVRAVKECGADAIKLQTYTADTITIDSDLKYFRIMHGTLWDGQNLYDLYKKAYTPWEWQPKLKKIAENLGLICFSSPFDRTAVDFLEKMRVPAYKVASFEITDIPLIEYIASKKKPVIISTGIAKMTDIKEAVVACRKAGNNQIALLKCVSSYPAPPEGMNLRVIPDMQERFKTVVGLSDHSMGIAAPVAAVSLGASIIEKHFILDKRIGGPDAPFSLEPREFKAMVDAVRETEKSLGEASYELSAQSRKNRRFARSLFAARDITKGEVFDEINVRSVRPAHGLKPKYLKKILGRKSKCFIKRGTPLKWRQVDIDD
ncbi:MAG: pseudaminic acid synthase [Elusimicrobiota bacterium]